MTSYLCAIGTANPPHRIPQSQIARFMADALSFDEAETRRLGALYRASGIGQRYSVLPDYAEENGNFTFFPNTPQLEPFPRVGPRMEQYRAHALPLAVAAVQSCLTQLQDASLPHSITHLVTVSCTGMYAPGLDIELVEALGLSPHVQRTCVNFMGCYAAFNGLKLADAFCRADAQARVLVVCAELCTLHFQKRRDDDDLVSNALFGDGAAAALVQAQPAAHGPSLSLQAFHCDLVPDGRADMAWHINDFGFEMTLSSYVPGLIKQGIQHLADGLLARLPVRMSDIKLFAIHPGGRRILEAIEQALGLTHHDNRFAYQVLRDYGNMSSATVLFVLAELMRDLTPAQDGAPVLSFAFGPGLTLEALLMEVKW
ncbi:type III polyketide synthase [Hymenobacter defluvii]|uniref:Type III polyketide synthase n=1 Tax=Hymenobacter defluvii TaxID=2054411 RepID=A0ABS3T9Y6_9BACT|nr:type III polyketide synthase [Hymenobacter defluvii]MBO3270143.1 type III polyketide synthase [Hymenobacter defluvii]